MSDGTASAPTLASNEAHDQLSLFGGLEDGGLSWHDWFMSLPPGEEERRADGSPARGGRDHAA